MKISCSVLTTHSGRDYSDVTIPPLLFFQEKCPTRILDRLFPDGVKICSKLLI